MLITRPAPEAATTAERVRALGFDPVVAPVLTVVRCSFAWPARVDAAVVTSGNALPSMSGREDCPVLAVGDATAARARAAGFAAVESAAGDASALAALVAARLPPQSHVLFPTAEGEGAALEAMLGRSGYVVHRRVGYLVRPMGALPGAAAAALGSGRLRAALFLSARTARVFRGLLPPALWPDLAGIDALAIGTAAAVELTPLPWARVRVPLAPTLDQVLALL